jgi:hypothetical protein
MAPLGALLRKAFGSRTPDSEAVTQVKAWTRLHLRAAPETVLKVNEIACTDPSCPGIETVILVMEPGRKTRAIKVQKPLEDVSEQDIIRALES